MVQLPRPELAERARLIRQYFSAYLHHDPPADFLRASAAGEAAAEAAGGGGAAARGVHGDGSTNPALSKPGRFDHDDGNREDLRAAARSVPASAKTERATSPQPELEGGAGVPSPVGKLREDVRRDRRHGGCGGSGGGGVVRMSEGFRERMAGLMAMLAVRSEGFYGRDIAHFFSAVQVRPPKMGGTEHENLLFSVHALEITSGARAHHKVISGKGVLHFSSCSGSGKP